MVANLHGIAIPDSDTYHSHLSLHLDDMSTAASTDWTTNPIQVQSAINGCRLDKQGPPWQPSSAQWRLGDIVVSPYISHMWNMIGKEQRMPCQSSTSCTFWINKPGKDPSFIANRRGINAVEPIAKAYLTTLGDEISQTVSDTWRPTEFGGLPKRGTTHAIVIAAELTHRLRRNKIHHALFLGDEERAFDNQDRTRIASALIKHAGDTPTVKRLLQRLNYTV